METLSSIERKLREVAKSNNVVGDSVELLIKLLAFNRYEALTSVNNTLLEYSPDSAVYLNSKIQHAMNEMYSVGRGRNSRILVTATVNGSVNLKEFDKVYSDKFNTFVYNRAYLNGELVGENYKFVHGTTYVLELIKVENVFEEEVSVDSNNKYIIELVDNDISEDFLVYGGSDLTSLQITTKDFGKHIDSSEEEVPLTFNLTLPDYGLRLYSPDSEGFSTTTPYLIKYIKFLDSSISAENLTKLTVSGFKVDLNNIEIVQREPRELVENFLYNLKKEMISQSRVKTNSDIVDMFRNYFTERAKDAKMLDYNLDTDTINLSYIPLNSNNSPSEEDQPEVITEIEMDGFKESLMYYVTKNFNLIPCMDEEAIKVELGLKVFISDNMEPEEIQEIISKYEYKLDQTIIKEELMGEINSISTVKYCVLSMYKLVSYDPLTEEWVKEEIEEISSGKDNYFLLTPHLNYTYKR